MKRDEAIDKNYGSDPNGSIATDNHGIVVPMSRIKFSDRDLQELKLAISPLGVTDNHGIDLYEQFTSTLDQI